MRRLKTVGWLTRDLWKHSATMQVAQTTVAMAGNVANHRDVANHRFVSASLSQYRAPAFGSSCHVQVPRWLRTQRMPLIASPVHHAARAHRFVKPR
jgi:hypothetical protein